jgi:hypothetical protein
MCKVHNLLLKMSHMGLDNRLLQNEFRTWIEWELPPCEICSPERGKTGFFLNSYRRIYRCIPHMNINDTWSLQNAVRYSSDLFLGKSYTNFRWSLLLNPLHSHLPSSTLQCQITLVNATENPIQPQHNDDLFSEISETDSVHELPPLSDPTSTRTKSHARRSTTARTRRNKKRNRVHRLTRYRHRLMRTVYHRFTMA